MGGRCRLIFEHLVLVKAALGMDLAGTMHRFQVCLLLTSFTLPECAPRFSCLEVISLLGINDTTLF